MIDMRNIDKGNLHVKVSNTLIIILTNLSLLFSKTHEDFFNTETFISVFDLYVTSIQNYNCEVWGLHKGAYIETLHIYYMKRISKVRNSTVNHMAYFELGRTPLYINRYIKMICY